MRDVPFVDILAVPVTGRSFILIGEAKDRPLARKAFAAPGNANSVMLDLLEHSATCHRASRCIEVCR